jgi:hypothetical protein
LGQEITGASTKEDLKVWVGDMLKLGTECLTEFMSGYRKGRDEEIDRWPKNHPALSLTRKGQ